MQLLTAWMGIMAIFSLVFVVVYLIPFWFIWKKAGFSSWLSLLMVLPLVNLVMLYVLAFSEWKVAPVAQLQYQAQVPPQYPRV
jgi:hypothetical protein